MYAISIGILKMEQTQMCIKFIQVQYIHIWNDIVNIKHALILTIQFSHTLREESSQTNVILQYKLLAAVLSAVCSVIQQS